MPIRVSRFFLKSVLPVYLAIPVGCAVPEAGDELDESEAGGAPAPSQNLQVQLNLLYVHGVKSCRQDRLQAENSLDELRAAIDGALPARIADYEADHPGVTIAARSAHANLYTAEPSPYHP